jgi:hypothetical protein
MYSCNQNLYEDFLAYTYFVLLKMLSSIPLRNFNVCFTLLKGKVSSKEIQIFEPEIRNFLEPARDLYGCS